MIGNSNKHNTDINNLNVTIIGLGKSGEGAANLAHFLGASVFVSDASFNPDIRKRSNSLESIGIEVEIGDHTNKIFDGELWILSPGVSQDSPAVKEAKSKGIPVISEITNEFANAFIKL